MLPAGEPVFVYSHFLRSRYGETDKMGYVYYGRYLEYFEVARTEMIRAAGIPYRRLEDEGFMLPVLETELKYLRPVFYDELMEIRVLIYDEPGIRLDTWYEVRTLDGTVLNTLGRARLCFIDEQTRKPVRAPQFFLDGLRSLMHASRT